MTIGAALNLAGTYAEDGAMISALEMLDEARAALVATIRRRVELGMYQPDVLDRITFGPQAGKMRGVRSGTGAAK